VKAVSERKKFRQAIVRAQNKKREQARKQAGVRAQNKKRKDAEIKDRKQIIQSEVNRKYASMNLMERLWRLQSSFHFQ